MTKEEMDEIIILGKLYGVLIKVDFGFTTFKYLAPNGDLYFYRGKLGNQPIFVVSSFVFTEKYTVMGEYEHNIINFELTEHKL